MKTDIKRIGFQHKEANIESYNAESRTISGYAAIFGNKDRDGDILLQGCFAKSIADRGVESEAKGKIMLLWQHQQSNPLGRITKLQEDEKGLYFEAEIDDIPEGDRCIKQLQSGTLNQFSIGFSYVWEKCNYDEELEAYIIGEVKLYEISVVSIAANPETEFTGMKSADADTITDKINHFCKGMSNEKQQELMKILSAVKSLSAVEPVREPLEEQKAEEAQKSVFDLFV